ncbi:PEP-CTERM sorting domain-containing protein [Gloeothece verrucosa]|uniref:PEP-CTERM protein-sorting domain-containing protein n=1 Tax=Gloeothece verrucosa (strain PCC 7822) TaxID=497965 RepID=E0U890_GLOV7|nr:PEP-CTERM sorting domain-containing protein [Gloeothece verrucosa]ADN17295.1 hypothetical protein Cyan7822_5419 [Gloeothece verrucosa PCC 7822]
MKNTTQVWTLLASVVGGALIGMPAAQAASYNSSFVTPVNPIPGAGIPTPKQVPGKEYVDSPNKDQNGAANAGQSLLWDGNGGVANGNDFGDQEVDALANHADALFYAVIHNQAALLFSTEGDGRAPILSESITGAGAIWATAAQIDANGVNDLDGLEVWGPEGVPDSDRYSLVGDPNGISVYALGGTPLITTSQIAAAIGRPELESQIDLDALMVYEPLSTILFSIRPIDNVFDGGEIWTWNGVGAAQFLNHGGHLWNTAFDVRGTFGTTSENVDGLEAVATPEPMTILGVATSLGFGTFFKRQKQNSSKK